MKIFKYNKFYTKLCFKYCSFEYKLFDSIFGLQILFYRDKHYTFSIAIPLLGNMFFSFGAPNKDYREVRFQITQVTWWSLWTESERWDYPKWRRGIINTI